jgi:hypothetical protein
MKISAITAELAAAYLRLDYANMTTAEVEALTNLINIAKAFIKSYTGLEDVSPGEEAVGTGDGVETEFSLRYFPITSQTVYIDGSAQTETTHYTIAKDTGVITFVTAPADGAEITATYSAVPSDGFEDFAIVVYILVQDMYDNRTLYVEKTNINRVIDMILGMHSVNLL